MRKKNFFAGPSVLPVEVLEEIRDQIVDYEGQGLSMIEASHRGGMFEDMYDECLLKFRKLLAFYRNIAPEKGWTRYSEVNLKYKGQIVCKLNNTPLKIKES